jgi:hypothetical protein
MNSYSLLPWEGGRGDYRDVFPVLGTDPYAWKGYVDRSVPHLRLWPDPGRPPTTRADLAYAIRRKISSAIGHWSHDEQKALSLFQEACAELESERNKSDQNQ